MIKSFSFLIIPFLIFFSYCSKENATEPDLTVIIFGEAKLISELTDEHSNVLGDTTIAINGIEVILLENHEPISITTTDQMGQYGFENVILGTYTVKARIKHILFESESNESDSLKLLFPFLDYYAGLLSIPTTGDLSDNDFEFETVYPNPGSNTVNIIYSHSQTMNLKIDIYNHQSELIKSYFNVENQEGGRYIVLWDFTDNKLSIAPSGIYIIYAESDSIPLYFTSAVKK